ncbi:MAG: CUB domain-containing protein, partial [Bacteroidota bacterium]
MKILRGISILVALSFISNSEIFAQIYSPASNQSYTTCSGTFYDSGGAAGTYNNSQNYTVTFCSGNGQPIYLSFTAFALETGWDYVYIYAGNSTASPLIGTYSGASPGVVSSANGCITVRFTSDGSVVMAGWAATIGCGTPPVNSNILMTSGTVSACSGTFYDSGGSTGNYANNLNQTFTICPSTPGSKVQVNFTQFNIENGWDFLTIYNGPNTASPTLGTYTGTAGPGLVQATAANASGCLTFVFTSDFIINAAGWQATINCTTPCQTINANFLSSTPNSNSNGIIRICPGQSVLFNGSGTFSTSGAGASYLWNFGDNTTGAGLSASHVYSTPGTYYVNLNITDPSGCTNSNQLNRMVQVSTIPTITTTASPLTLCPGQSASLSASVTYPPFIQNCTPPVSVFTFLPDGTGLSTSSPVTVNCYNSNQTISSANDIQSICLNMEHSWLADLSISLTCPNGQSVLLKPYPSGTGIYLGCPLDDPAVGPGTGSNYCFTPTATTLLINGGTTNCGTPAAASVVAGNYMPAQPFTNLIGCPLNGTWSINVTDNMALDNGYLFNWDLNFNPSIPTTNGSFTPSIVSQGWVSNSTLTSTGPTTATVSPTSPGQNCYTYSVTNNFGCTATAQQCVNVTTSVTPIFSQLGPYCVGATPGVLPTISNNGITGSWSSGISTATPGSIIYTFVPNSGQCASSTSMTIVVNGAPVINLTPNSVSCSGLNNGSIGVTATGLNAGFNVSWNGPSFGNPSGLEILNSGGTYSIPNLAPGAYTITTTNQVGCTASTSVTITSPTPLLASSSSTAILCSGGQSTVSVVGSGGTLPYTGTGTFSVGSGTTNYT